MSAKDPPIPKRNLSAFLDLMGVPSEKREGLEVEVGRVMVGGPGVEYLICKTHDWWSTDRSDGCPECLKRSG